MAPPSFFLSPLVSRLSLLQFSRSTQTCVLQNNRHHPLSLSLSPFIMSMFHLNFRCRRGVGVGGLVLLFVFFVVCLTLRPIESVVVRRRTSSRKETISLVTSRTTKEEDDERQQVLNQRNTEMRIGTIPLTLSLSHSLSPSRLSLETLPRDSPSRLSLSSLPLPLPPPSSPCTHTHPAHTPTRHTHAHTLSQS